jgi:CRISPR/Cas system CMR-associated protein Cmr3 (group 5 of RAMP superfamily)
VRQKSGLLEPIDGDIIEDKLQKEDKILKKERKEFSG